WHDSAGQRVEPAARIRVISPVAAVSHSPAVHEEIGYLRGLPRKRPLLAATRPLPVLAWDVMGMMEAGMTGLFHFAAHGATPARAAEAASIAVGADHLTADDIHNTFADGLQRSEPFVFMNGDRAARPVAGAKPSDSWAPRLLESGCSAFI